MSLFLSPFSSFLPVKQRRTGWSQTPFKQRFTRINEKTSTFFPKRAIKKKKTCLYIMENNLFLRYRYKLSFPNLYLTGKRNAQF